MAVPTILIEVNIELRRTETVWLALLLRNREVPASNLGPVTGYPDKEFSWFSSVLLGKFREIILNNTTTASFQIIFNLLLTNCRLIQRRTGSVIK
jgi:hypothetical protein